MNVEETVRFILDQQAQLTATVGQLAETTDSLAHKVDGLAETVGGLAQKVDGLAETVDRIGQKVDRTADSVIALLAIAEIHDREIKETDERLSVLINTVERLIGERRNGRADT